MTAEDPILDRQGLEVLDVEECWRLFRGAGVARVAFVDQGAPVILPINIGVYGHRIVFRTTNGSKLSAAMRHQPVAVEIDNCDWEVPRGWSVVAKGTAMPVDDADLLAELEGIGVEPWARQVPRDQWVQVMVDELTGRRVVAER